MYKNGIRDLTNLNANLTLEKKRRRFYSYEGVSQFQLKQRVRIFTAIENRLP